MERRVRTYWVVRERYRVAANAATVLGALAGVAAVAWLSLREPTPPLDAEWAVATAVLVALAALVPRLVVRGLWRLRRERLRERLG